MLIIVAQKQSIQVCWLKAVVFHQQLVFLLVQHADSYGKLRIFGTDILALFAAWLFGRGGKGGNSCYQHFFFEVG